MFLSQHACEPTSPMTTYAASVSAAVGHHHDANLRHRPTMEDEMSVHECDDFPGLFVGVYDGHGGCTASQYLRQLLHRLFLDELLNEEHALAPRPQPSSSSPSPVTERQTSTTKTTRTRTATREVEEDDEDMHSTCSTPPYDEDEDVDEDELKKNDHALSVGTHRLSPSCSSMSKDSIVTADSDEHSPRSLHHHKTRQQSDHHHHKSNTMPPSINAMQIQQPTSQQQQPTTTSSQRSSRRRRVRTSPTVVIQHPLNTPKLDVERAFRLVYPKMDTVLRLRNCARVGATSVTAFLRRVPSTSSSTWARTLTVANCGDSRAVLCRNGTSIELTQSHRPCDPDERARVEQAGGFVSCGRINGLLNVSRAFGDHWMKSIVPCMPHVTTVEIDERVDEFVVLGCDGLWDFVSDEIVIATAREMLMERMMAPHAVAKLLVELALSKGSTDNVSVMVLQFQVDDDED